MNPDLERFLEQLFKFGRAHDAKLEDRRERLAERGAGDGAAAGCAGAGDGRSPRA
jgi:hypothetical protein